MTFPLTPAMPFVAGQVFPFTVANVWRAQFPNALDATGGGTWATVAPVNISAGSATWTFFNPVVIGNSGSLTTTSLSTTTLGGPATLNNTFTVSSSGSVVVAANGDITVQASGDVNFESNSDLNIANGARANVLGTLSILGSTGIVEIASNANGYVRDGGDLTIEAGGVMRVTGTLIPLSAGVIRIDQYGDLEVLSGGDLNLKTGSTTTVETGATFRIQGVTANILSGGRLNVDSGGDLRFAAVGATLSGTLTDSSTKTRTGPTTYDQATGYRMYRELDLAAWAGTTTISEGHQYDVINITGDFGADAILKFSAPASPPARPVYVTIWREPGTNAVTIQNQSSIPLMTFNLTGGAGAVNNMTSITIRFRSGTWEIFDYSGTTTGSGNSFLIG
jgi:hypothetical protein